MIYLDTSAMIRAWRLKLAPAQITRAHSVAEFYATLTGGLTITISGVKTRVQFSPKEVTEGARFAFSAMTFQDLNGAQALDELDGASKDNVHAANIHDWMHAAVAEASGCREIVTTNVKHFKLVTNLKLTEPVDFFGKP